MSHFKPVQSPSTFRKVAMAMWRRSNDPTILFMLEVDFTEARQMIQRYNACFGRNVTVTHLVGRALAIILAEHPEANTKVEWGRAWQRETIDIFYTVAVNGGEDLSGTKIGAVDKMTLGGLEK